MLRTKNRFIFPENSLTGTFMCIIRSVEIVLGQKEENVKKQASVHINTLRYFKN